VNLIESFSEQNSPNPYSRSDGRGTPYSLARGAHYPEGAEEERRHACEEPDFGDQHGPNPTRFVLISKHEVMDGQSKRRALIKKDHIESKCKKRHIFAREVSSSALAGFATLAPGEHTQGDAPVLSERVARRVLSANRTLANHSSPTPHPEIFP
jgi:hypothetical protein